MPKGVYVRTDWHKSRMKGCFTKGHEVPQEWRDTFSKKITGRKHTEEAKQKIAIHSKGENNPMWNGGININRGYKYIRVGRRKYLPEHRLIWVQHNQIPIPIGWEIHHRNGDKLDNRIENLVCIPTDLHAKFHMMKRLGRIDDGVNDNINVTELM